jgi:hypothetical protein
VSPRVLDVVIVVDDEVELFGDARGPVDRHATRPSIDLPLSPSISTSSSTGMPRRFNAASR